MEDFKMLCDKNVEYSVLGAVILDNSLFYQINTMKEDSFNFIECRDLFKAIKSNMREYDKTDITLIGAWIASNKSKLTISKVMEIQESTPTTANFEGYLSVLIDYYNKREIKKLMQSMDMSVTSEELKNKILNKITEVFVEKEQKEDTAEVTMNVCEEILLKKQVHGIKTGINLIDLGLGGLRRGSYTLLVAESGVGKTIMAVNMFRYMIKNKAKAQYFSLEIKKDELIKRMLSAESKIEYKGIFNNNIDERREEDLVNASQKIASCKFDIIDDTYDLDNIISKMKIAKAKGELDVVFIDQISLVGTNRRFSTDTEREAYISTQFKRIAMELDVPVVILAQVLLKETAKANDKRPTLANIQGATKKIQDADLVMALYRDKKFSDKQYVARKKQTNEVDYNSMDADLNPEVIEIDFLKSRNSTMARYSLSYKGEYQLIESRNW